MNIVKMGTAHRDIGMNCQDATNRCQQNNVKIVCDGCSEGKHTEVGANLFACRFINNYVDRVRNANISTNSIPTILSVTLDNIINQNFKHDPTTYLNYLTFTILVSSKNNDGFDVYSCGDGYIIIQDDEGIHFEKLDCGEYPKYLVYNFIDPSYLKQYKDGVGIEHHHFDNAINVGVASDGIRFVVDRPDDDLLKNEFIDILKSGKEIKMKRFINRNPKVFQDDVSILF